MALQTNLLLWIILLPLIGSAVNGIFGAIPWKTFPRIPATASGFVATGSVFLAFLLTVKLFLSLIGNGEVQTSLEQIAFEWIHVGDFNIPMEFRMDGLSGLLTLVVTGVGTLIHLYSIGYMGHDENPQRYFSYLNLFTASMLILILGANLPILFIGWEGVGLCSYLLIGFWFQDIEKAKAGKKAFVVNRVGDLAFLIGMFLLFQNFKTLNFQELSSALSSSSVEIGFGILTLISLLLFIGATGKSAQLPLFVWLPDAMAGPTPVSALIHAATMVTAGVYMTCRMSFLYSLTPITSLVIAVVAVLTAFVAATIAIVQNDIKKVLAYSTVSQLGYMFLAVGVGAYVTAIFHLMTHAFFKALMFLGSGSVIHACDGEQDMRKMGGLKEYMPITYWTFAIGTLAISGIPIFSGFFSKDEILWQTFSSPLGGLPLYIIGLMTAGLTATYMGRLFFMTFHGKNRASEKVRSHLHESPLVMTIPLMVLAFLAALGGFLGFPHFMGGHVFPNALEHLLHGILPLNQGHGSAAMEWGLVLVSVLVASGGLFLASRIYIQNPEKQASGPLVSFLENSYYLNELYEAIFVRPIQAFSIFLWKIIDVILIDGFVLVLGKGSKFFGSHFRTLQTGKLEHYLLAFIGGLVSLAILYMFLI
ncbi:MAG: NADH-quinone oxidoreductase subunit L [Oligoflexia bacterium]|nr:NADH-quinone oxidoreductase subunit L [Oligoflexia bacterium]